MAKVRNGNGSLVSGKLNKKNNEVHRVINGQQFKHSIENPYDGPASKAQIAQQSNFGKTNAILNRLMADPVQVAEWKKEMEEYNRSICPNQPPYPERYTTVRAFAYHVISEQLKQAPAAKRKLAKLPISLPKGVKLQIKAFSDLSTAELYEILKARFTVFVAEQHIHYVDEDNIDYLATHFSLRQNGKVIAYARLFPQAQKDVLCVGRMLTLVRGRGYAKYLMTRIIEEARKRSAHTLRMHAQTQAAPFYEHLGFHTVGDVFTEAELPHILMEMTLE